MFLSLPATVDKVHHGDGHEDHRHRRKEEGTLHRSNPIACWRRTVEHGIGSVFKANRALAGLGSV